MEAGAFVDRGGAGAAASESFFRFLQGFLYRGLQAYTHIEQYFQHDQLRDKSANAPTIEYQMGASNQKNNKKRKTREKKEPSCLLLMESMMSTHAGQCATCRMCPAPQY